MPHLRAPVGESSPALRGHSPGVGVPKVRLRSQNSADVRRVWLEGDPNGYPRDPPAPSTERIGGFPKTDGRVHSGAAGVPEDRERAMLPRLLLVLRRKV